MADESGKFISDSNALGIESMKLHKQRLSKIGKAANRGEYKLPEADVVSIVGGMLVSDSKQVRSSQCMVHQSPTCSLHQLSATLCVYTAEQWQDCRCVGCYIHGVESLHVAAYYCTALATRIVPCCGVTCAVRRTAHVIMHGQSLSPNTCTYTDRQAHGMHGVHPTSRRFASLSMSACPVV